MARPPSKLNHEVLNESMQQIELLERYFDVYAQESELLSSAYLEEREQIMARRGESNCHGLFLSFETKKCEETGLRFGYLYWRMGRARHNSAAGRASRRSAAPITRNLHACGTDGAYTKRNLRAAMPFAKPWEFQLTCRYEMEAHKIRKFIRTMNDWKRSLMYFPTAPIIEIPSATGKGSL